jgi:hypothetical protein
MEDQNTTAIENPRGSSIKELTWSSLLDKSAENVILQDSSINVEVRLY